MHLLIAVLWQGFVALIGKQGAGGRQRFIRWGPFYMGAESAIASCLQTKEHRVLLRDNWTFIKATYPGAKSVQRCTT